MILDHLTRGNVNRGMSTRLARFGRLPMLAAALFVLAAACGGKDKKATTTPDKAKTDTAQSMKDTDPVDPGSSGSSGSNNNSGTGATTGGGLVANTGSGGGSSTSEPPAPPPIVPPNLDPDPAQARSAVEEHLKTARKALGQSTPEPDTALREARLALAVDAANLDAAAMVALAYYHKRMYDTAELVLDDLFRRETAKRNANVLYAYGLVYDKTNRAANALLAFKTAVELDGSHTSAMTNLGVYQLRNKQYDEATTTFEKLTTQFQRADAITLTSLGSAYRGKSANFPPGGERDSLLQKAEEAYKRAITANTNYGPAYYNIGLLYLDADPMPTGSGAMDTLARLQKAKTYFDSYKGIAGFDVKLYDERIKDVSKAVKREEKRRKKAAQPNP